MLLKGGLIYDQKTGSLKKGDLRIRGEEIAEISKDLDKKDGEKVYDISGKYLLPGIIDSHTHFELKSRGTVSSDDFYNGTISAAYGGVTTVIDYADQNKDSINKGLETRKEKAKDKSIIDYNFHLVINNDFEVEKHLEEISDLPKKGITSLKLFTTYEDIYMLDDSKMKSIFRAAAEAGLVVTVHSEDNQVIKKREKKYIKEGKTDYRYHPEIRTGKAEKKAIEKLAEYAKDSGAELYIVHLSSKEGCDAVVEAREEGVDIKVETTPHYLLLTDRLLEGSEARYNFMTPPLRKKEDNKKLWKGIEDGVIDTIATDHCAFSPEKKERGEDVFDTFPGIPGVETLFPLIYTYGVEKGRIDIKRLIELVSSTPAKIFGLYPKKGSLKEGTDADILVYDPDREESLRAEKLHSQAEHTSYEGMKVTGTTFLTIVRGKVLIEDGDFIGEKGYGKFLKAAR